MTGVILHGVVSPERHTFLGAGRGMLRGSGRAGLKFPGQGFAFRVSRFVMRVSGFELRVSGFELRVSDFEFRVSGFEERVWGSETHRHLRSPNPEP